MSKGADAVYLVFMYFDNREGKQKEAVKLKGINIHKRLHCQQYVFISQTTFSPHVSPLLQFVFQTVETCIHDSGSCHGSTYVSVRAEK